MTRFAGGCHSDDPTAIRAGCPERMETQGVKNAASEKGGVSIRGRSKQRDGTGRGKKTPGTGLGAAWLEPRPGRRGRGKPRTELCSRRGP